MKKIIFGLFIVSLMTSCSFRMVTIETTPQGHTVYSQYPVDTISYYNDNNNYQNQCTCGKCDRYRNYRNFNGPAPNLLGHCNSCHEDTVKVIPLAPLIDTKIIAVKKPVVKPAPKRKPRTTVHRKLCTCPICHKSH